MSKADFYTLVDAVIGGGDFDRRVAIAVLRGMLLEAQFAHRNRKGVMVTTIGIETVLDLTALGVGKTSSN